MGRDDWDDDYDEITSWDDVARVTEDLRRTDAALGVESLLRPLPPEIQAHDREQDVRITMWLRWRHARGGKAHCVAQVWRPSVARPMVVLSEVATNPSHLGVTSDLPSAADALRLTFARYGIAAAEPVWVLHHGAFSYAEPDVPETWTRAELVWDGQRYHDDLDRHHLLTAGELVLVADVEPIDAAVRRLPPIEETAEDLLAGSVLGQLRPRPWSLEQDAAYHAARECLLGMIGWASADLHHAEQAGDEAAVENTRRRRADFARRVQALDYDDREEIERVRVTYGPMLRRYYEELRRERDLPTED